MKFFINQHGSERITVGGVKSLVDFSSEEVILATKKGTIRIFGDMLEILYFNCDEICLKGRISGYDC